MIDLNYELYKESNDFIESKVSKEYCKNNTYKNKVTYFASYIKPGMTVIDAGACVGVFTVLFDKLVLPNGRVYAFEPDISNYINLVKNVGDSTTSFTNSALSNYHGTGFLCKFKDYIGWHYLTESSKEDNVYVTYIDKFCKDNGVSKVDLMKIDVEGADLKVLQGAEETIHRNKNISIIIEIHNGGRFLEQKNDVLEFLRNRGFTLYDLNDNFNTEGKMFEVLATR